MGLRPLGMRGYHQVAAPGGAGSPLHQLGQPGPCCVQRGGMGGEGRPSRGDLEGRRRGRQLPHPGRGASASRHLGTSPLLRRAHRACLPAQFHSQPSPCAWGCSPAAQLPVCWPCSPAPAWRAPRATWRRPMASPAKSQVCGVRGGRSCRAVGAPPCGPAPAPPEEVPGPSAAGTAVVVSVDMQDGTHAR